MNNELPIPAFMRNDARPRCDYPLIVPKESQQEAAPNQPEENLQEIKKSLPDIGFLSEVFEHTTNSQPDNVKEDSLVVLFFADKSISVIDMEDVDMSWDNDETPDKYKITHYQIITPGEIPKGGEYVVKKTSAAKSENPVIFDDDPEKCAEPLTGYNVWIDHDGSEECPLPDGVRFCFKQGSPGEYGPNNNANTYAWSVINQFKIIGERYKDIPPRPEGVGWKLHDGGSCPPGISGVKEYEVVERRGKKNRHISKSNSFWVWTENGNNAFPKSEDFIWYRKIED